MGIRFTHTRFMNQKGINVKLFNGVPAYSFGINFSSQTDADFLNQGIIALIKTHIEKQGEDLEDWDIKYPINDNRMFIRAPYDEKNKRLEWKY